MDLAKLFGKFKSRWFGSESITVTRLIKSDSVDISSKFIISFIKIIDILIFGSLEIQEGARQKRRIISLSQV